MKYLVFIRYDGTKFHGFQRQKKEKSVQKVLEDSLSELLEEPIVIKGAGRTDAGVHALNQAFHFETKTKLPANFKRVWNQKLNYNDNNYFLDFVTDNKKKNSYAASFGKNNKL